MSPVINAIEVHHLDQVSAMMNILASATIAIVEDEIGAHHQTVVLILGTPPRDLALLIHMLIPYTAAHLQTAAKMNVNQMHVIQAPIYLSLASTLDFRKQRSPVFLRSTVMSKDVL